MDELVLLTGMWGRVRLEGCPGNVQVLRDYFLSHACMLNRFSHIQLHDPVDYSLPGSSVHWILQARILSGLPCPLPGDLPDPGIEPASPMSPALAGGFFATGAPWGTTVQSWIPDWAKLPPLQVSVEVSLSPEEALWGKLFVVGFFFIYLLWPPHSPRRLEAFQAKESNIN